MKLLVTLITGTTLVGGLLFFWLQRDPTTQLVDASGRALTTGSAPEGEADVEVDLFAAPRAALEAFQFAAAADQLREILETSDRDGETCTLLARATTGLEEYDEAVDWGLKAIELRPESAEAHLAYATALGLQIAAEFDGIAGIFKAMGRLGRFKDELFRVIELDPDDTEARTMLAFYYMMAPAPIGDIDAAWERCEEIHALDPVAGTQMRAMCRYQMDEVEEAIGLCREGIATWPDEREIRATLAELLVEEERFEEADVEFAAARAGEADEVYWRALYGQARMRTEQDFELEEAVAMLDEYIAADPKGKQLRSAAHACWRRGLALEKLKRIDEARAAYEECLRRKPDHEQALEALDDLDD